MSSSMSQPAFLRYSISSSSPFTCASLSVYMSDKSSISTFICASNLFCSAIAFSSFFVSISSCFCSSSSFVINSFISTINSSLWLLNCSTTAVLNMKSVKSVAPNTYSKYTFSPFVICKNDNSSFISCSFSSIVFCVSSISFFASCILKLYFSIFAYFSAISCSFSFALACASALSSS